MRNFILIMIAVALASCPCSAATARAGEPVTIDFWTSEIHEDRLAVIGMLVRVFEAMHDGVRVRVTSVNENDLFQQATANATLGQGPDLVNTGGELIVAMGEKGLMDLNATEIVLGKIGAGRFFPGALAFFAAPGSKGYYGLPFHGWVQGVWYRADWFDEKGLKEPVTWQNMLRAAETLHDPAGGVYGILVGTDTDQYAEQVFTQIALAGGAAMFSPRGELVFDSPAMVRALEHYLKLARNTPPGAQTWRGRDFYMQGRLGMLFYSTFIMDDLAISSVARDSLGKGNFSKLSGAPFDPDLVHNTRMASLLKDVEAVGYGMVNGMGVFRSGADKLATVTRFIEFLYQPANYVEWLHMAPGGMLPVLRDVAESDAFMRDPQGVFRRYGRPKIREILSGLDNIRSFGLVHGHRQPMASVFYAERIIPRMIDKARRGEMTPAQAVSWAEDQMRMVMEQTVKK